MVGRGAVKNYARLNFRITKQTRGDPMKLKHSDSHDNAATAAALLIATLACTPMLTGCVAVGYSSSGGWFIWPGGIGLLFLVLIIALLLRRR